MSDDDAGQATAQRVPAYASGLVFVGVWGLVLAVLNMIGRIHPTYHVSWGGLFTFEATNAAFGTAKDGFHFEPMGDTVFIAICVLMITIGARSINERSDIAAWVRGLLRQRHMACT